MENCLPCTFEKWFWRGMYITMEIRSEKKKPYAQHHLILLKMQINRSYAEMLVFRVIFAFFFFLICIFCIIYNKQYQFYDYKNDPQHVSYGLGVGRWSKMLHSVFPNKCNYRAWIECKEGVSEASTMDGSRWIAEGDQTLKSHWIRGELTIFFPPISSSQESKAAWRPEILTRCGQKKHQEKTFLLHLQSGKGPEQLKTISWGFFFPFFLFSPMATKQSSGVTSYSTVTAVAVGRHLKLRGRGSLLRDQRNCGPKSVQWIHVAVHSLVLSPLTTWPWTQAQLWTGSSWNSGKGILENKKVLVELQRGWREWLHKAGCDLLSIPPTSAWP